MLPDNALRISSSLGFGLCWNNSYAVIRKPGVQKPHCSACFSQKAFWRGCSSPPRANPSTVITSWPLACTANIRHERTLCPSTSTVQEPQAPCSQPRLVPVNPKSSRNTSANKRRGSTTRRWVTPLTVKRIVTKSSSCIIGSFLLALRRWLMPGWSGRQPSGGDSRQSHEYRRADCPAQQRQQQQRQPRLPHQGAARAVALPQLEDAQVQVLHCTAPGGRRQSYHLRPAL